MAQTRSRHDQPLCISAKVERMALSNFLKEHLSGLDCLIQQCIERSQWVIFQANSREVSGYTYLSLAENSIFPQLYREIQQQYGILSQKAASVSFDVENSQLSTSLQNNLQASQIIALTLFPLMDDQGYLGILCLGYPYPSARLGENELGFLKAIACQATLIIRHNLQKQQLKSDKAKEKLLQTLFRDFNQDMASPYPWRSLLGTIGQYFGFERVVLLSFQGKQVIIEQEWRSNPNLVPWQPFDSLEASYQPADYQNNEDDQENELEFPSNGKVNLSFSLKVKEYCFGRLILQSPKENHDFTPEEINLLQLIGEIIAILGEYCRFNQELSDINQTNQAKGEFLSYMTHELRTPLSGILGFARMLNKELYGELNSKQKEYVKGIAASGEHLLSLVNDFLDFSKLEAKKEELVWEAMVVEELCQSVLAIVQSKANEQGLDLILDIEEKIDIFKADKRRIKQILLNLLSNAVKFTEEGFVMLQVKRSHNSLLFSVIDTGIGIEEEDKGKLFAPYEQIKSKVGQKHKGTGLGLTISRQLAQLHGGDLTVTSDEGKGSCFTLTLPQNRE